jgi:uncharacterized membrane protein
MDRKTEIVLRRYLGEIETELAGLSRTARQEIVTEIRSHLLEEWCRCDQQSTENLMNIINNFGEPREIAAGYLEEYSGLPAVSCRSEAPYPPSWLVIVLTVFLWPAGIILAWLSPAWKTRDKLIATLIPLLLFLIVVVGGRALYSYDGKAGVKKVETIEINIPKEELP